MPASECRHILASGQKCHSVALKNRPWCYFHNRSRLAQRDRAAAAARAGKTPLNLEIPVLEDHPAIQVAISNTAQAYIAGLIDQSQARTINSMCRAATGNLAAHRRAAESAAKAALNPSPQIVADSVDTVAAPDQVTELTTLPNGETAAPLVYAPAPPCDCILNKTCSYACKCACHNPQPDPEPGYQPGYDPDPALDEPEPAPDPTPDPWRAAWAEASPEPLPAPVPAQNAAQNPVQKSASLPSRPIPAPHPAPRQKPRTLDEYIRQQCELHEEELKSKPREKEIHETYKSCPSWYSAAEKEEWARTHPDQP